jgi:O-antigen/teichoic acid export membrane protein
VTAPLQDCRVGKVAADVTGTVLTRLGTLGLGLMLAALRGRGLGREAFGAFSLAILVPTLLTAFLQVGVPRANAYFLSRGDVSTRDALKTTLRAWMALSLLGLVGGSVVVGWKGTILFPGVSLSVLWIALALFPALLLRVFLLSLLQGLQDFRWYNVLQIFDLAVILASTFLAILVFDLGTAGAMVAYCVGSMLGLPVCFWRLRSYLVLESGVTRAEKDTNACSHYRWKATVAGWFAFLNGRADVFLVNVFLNPAATGAYAVALVITEKLSLLSQSVSTVVFTRLARLHAQSDVRNRLTPLVSRWVLLATLILVAPLAVCARPLLCGLFGAEYAEASGALLWLLPGAVLASSGRVLANDIAARGRVDLNMYAAALLFAVNLTANLLLIPRFGINGAAMASTLGWVVHTVVILWLYVRLSGGRWWSVMVPAPQDWQLATRMIRRLHAPHVNPANSGECRHSQQTRPAGSRKEPIVHRESADHEPEVGVGPRVGSASDGARTGEVLTRMEP